MKISNNFLVILFIFCFICYDNIINSLCVKRKNIKIGVLIKENFPRDQLGAFNVARLVVTRKKYSEIPADLLNNQPDFKCISRMNVSVDIKKVNRFQSLAQIAKWVTKENYDGIFQFIEDSCDYEAAMSGALNVAFLAPECSHTESTDKRLFPTFARVNPSISKAAKSIIGLMRQFSWRSFTLVYSLERKWKLAGEVLKQFAQQEGITVKFEKHIKEGAINWQYFRKMIESTYRETRIYVLIAPLVQIIRFSTQIENMGIANKGEYVIICVSDQIANQFERFQKNKRKINRKYEDQYPDNFTSAEKSMLFVTTATPKPIIYEAFGLAICQQGYKGICHLKSQIPSERSIMLQTFLTSAAVYAYDVTMIFFRAVDNILWRNDSVLNGRKILQEILNKPFKSINGLNVYINADGDAEGNFTVSSFVEIEKGKRSLKPVAYFVHEPNKIIPKFTMFAESHISWISNHPPPDEPKCGFSGEKCQLELNVLALTISITMFAVLSIIILVASRYWISEQKLSSLLWKVDFKDIMLTEPCPNYDGYRQRNFKDLDNHYSFLVADEIETRKRHRKDQAVTKAFTKIGSYKGIVVSIKFLNHKSIELTRKFRQEMQYFKDLNQENLNRIIGACIDPPNICILTLYCSRGSLKDILSNKDIYLDEIFVASLVFDLIRGMIYLHDSQINYHGNLRTSKCLIDSRWILQISGFGLKSIRYASSKNCMVWSHSYDTEKNYYYKLLWKSPEHLKEPYPMRRGSQKGDVYAFSIIFHELTHQNGPWGDLYRSGNAAEIIGKLKSEPVGEQGSIRPAIDENVIPYFVKDCLNDCWDEVPEKRPDFKFIRITLKPLLKGLRSNIFDNMLLIMEKYAKNLEVLVEERTWQLTEEKKKIERLLLRMLPKSVTEQLKVGQTVVPEHYSCVTIYFSDIVGFTSLSASSTPMEVVQMLNDLYTLFDSIINEYDVYKVETIGDAYMVVSGLPVRNENMHAGEIASLSLHLLNAIKSFVIRHKPNETLKLRIGIHSGPCVAGVVGLKMPRYCLFGDTVNTASRMEATGEALKIHTSSDSKMLLDRLGGYSLTKRGVIDVKGKGVMETYFLEREDESVRTDRLRKIKKKENFLNDEFSEEVIEKKSNADSNDADMYANEFLRKISSSSHNSINNIYNTKVAPIVDFKGQLRSNRHSTYISNLCETNSALRSLSYPSKSDNFNSFMKSSDNPTNHKNGNHVLFKRDNCNHVTGDFDAAKSLLHDSGT